MKKKFLSSTALLIALTLPITQGLNAQQAASQGSLSGAFAVDSASIASNQEAQTQEEVVVVGYGTQRKKDVTGASSILGSRDFNKGLITSPDQLIAGKMAGVQVTSSSGDPGGEASITIRGVSSIRSNNNPLYVVDGVPLDGGNTQATMEAGNNSASGAGLGNNTAGRNPLNFLNPSDIESITVLKDASATAIYGSRGANGVVLITTKKGKSGANQITLDVSYGLSFVAKTYDLLSKDAFLNGAKAALKATGGSPYANSFDKGVINIGSVNETRIGTFNTNWQDQIFQVGQVQNYALGYGGATENANYRVSLSYMNQDGVIKNSGSQRITARFNATQDLFNHKVKLETNVTGAQTEDKYAPISNDAGYEGSLIGSVILSNPSAPVKYVDGLYTKGDIQGSDAQLSHTYYQPGNDQRNPAALLAYVKDVAVTNRLLGNFGISVIPVKGLTYKFLLGYDVSQSNRKTSYNANLNIDGISPSNVGTASAPIYAGGRALVLGRNNSNYNLTHTLNYETVINDHSLNVLAGFEYIKYQRSGSNAAAQGFLNYDITNADQMYNTFQTPNSYLMSSFINQNDLQSFFGRLNYSFKDKYLLTLTVRNDGSSRFGENNKYATFPALAAAWKVDRESFMPKGIFDELKLRFGWGITGNQEFPSNLTLATFSYNRTSGGSTQKNNPNPDLKWEQTTSLNIGFDFAILQNRIYGTVDYFDRSTSNMLMQVAYAQPAATEYMWKNLEGNVINRGVEFLLGAVAYQNNKFRWDVSVNFTYLKNTVEGFKNIINSGAVSGQGLSGAYAQRIVNGQPINVFYMSTFTGFDANGYNTFADGGQNNYQGPSSPTALYGITNTLTYENISLNFTFNGAGGFYVYNNTANAYFTKGSLKNGRNVTTDVANSSENPLNPAPVSTRFLEDGTFLRLSNATLAYRLDLSKKTSYIKSVRFYITGQNLLLFTKYSGLDPEVNVNRPYSNNGVPSASMDYGAYPRSRTVLLGASFEF